MTTLMAYVPDGSPAGRYRFFSRLTAYAWAAGGFASPVPPLELTREFTFGGIVP